MTAGNQYTSASISGQAAAAVIAVRNALAGVTQLYTWANSIGTAGIEAAPAAGGVPQISAADASTTLAALADLAGLAQIFAGQPCTIGFGNQVATGPPYNFMTFGEQLTGGQ